MGADYGEVSDADYIAAAKQEGVEPDYERVGRYVTARRAALPDVTLTELVRRSGVSQKTWKRLSDGQKVVQPAKLAAMSRALGWTPESIAVIRYGGEPAPSVNDEGGLQMVALKLLAQLQDEVHELGRRVSALDGQPFRTGRERR